MKMEKGFRHSNENHQFEEYRLNADNWLGILNTIEITNTIMRLEVDVIFKIDITIRKIRDEYQLDDSYTEPQE